MLRKTVIAVALLGVIAGLPYYLYSRITHARREAVYTAKMTEFQRDLRIGMTRDEVLNYLRWHSPVYNAVQYGGSKAVTYQIKVGEEPGDGVVCKSWTVYVVMEFGPTDHLSTIHLSRIGTCI
jgi:hypothetical protein